MFPVCVCPLSSEWSAARTDLIALCKIRQVAQGQPLVRETRVNHDREAQRAELEYTRLHKRGLEPAAVRKGVEP